MKCNAVNFVVVMTISAALFPVSSLGCVPEAVARTNSLIALFVLRKCLAIGGTIIVILENPKFFLSVCSRKNSNTLLQKVTVYIRCKILFLY